MSSQHPYHPQQSIHVDPATGRRYSVDPATGQSQWLDGPPPPAPTPGGYAALYPGSAPAKRKHTLRNVILGVVGVLVVMGGCSALLSTGGPQSSTTATSAAADQPPMIVNPQTFGDEYEANKVAANAKYAGQRVRLTPNSGGPKVTNINEGRVSLGGVTTNKFSLTQISCRLRDGSQALQVAKGNLVEITGTVDDGQSLGVITFKDCVIS